VRQLGGWVVPESGDQRGDIGGGLQERPDLAVAGEDDQCAAMVGAELSSRKWRPPLARQGR
jgi:hypothetical protein